MDLSSIVHWYACYTHLKIKLTGSVVPRLSLESSISCSSANGHYSYKCHQTLCYQFTNSLFLCKMLFSHREGGKWPGTWALLRSTSSSFVFFSLVHSWSWSHKWIRHRLINYPIKLCLPASIIYLKVQPPSTWGLPWVQWIRSNLLFYISYAVL